MGAVLFLGFVFFVFFVGTLFLPAGFLLNKKHKVLSVISFVISGIFMTPFIASICFYCVMTIHTAKNFSDIKKKEGIILYSLEYHDKENKILKNIEKGDVTIVSENGNTALHYSSRYDYAKVTERLIEKGCDVNQRNNYNEVPLHHVSSPEIVEILLAAGADIDAENDNGNTPLHSNADESEIEEVLIKHGADVTRRNKYGETPLHCAASSILFKPENAKPFITVGADINAKNNKGETPLLCCIKFNSYISSNILDALTYMIESGADVSICDDEGNDLKYYLQKKISEDEEKGKDLDDFSYKAKKDLLEKISS